MIAIVTVTISRADEPVTVSVCQLKKDPAAYNHKLVEVTGFVTHAARNFTIYDPTCPSWPAIWLEYGGSINSGTVACCKTLSDRRRPQSLVIENIPLPLTDNPLFRDFDKAIQPPFRAGQSGAVEHATLIGTFFAGQQMETATEHYWGGYGYMGCCSLFAIQEVKDADAQRRSDLDYGESNEKLDLPNPDCTLRMLLPDEQNAALVQAQHDADSGARAWALTDPARVAADALSHLTKKKSLIAADVKLTLDSMPRKTYQWAGKNKTYTVVVSRPYWLSYYGRDSKEVAWVAVAAYETSCSTGSDTE
ncbi:MAG: hypothetical protein WBQ79_06985 [Acidobacteriaceae bacterium]